MRSDHVTPGSLALLEQHLVDEIDDGPGRLLGVVLREQVALVAPAAARPAPGHEPEDAPGGSRPRRRVGRDARSLGRLRPPPVGRVGAAEGDCSRGEVLAEEASPGTVRQRDPLRGHLREEESRGYD